jgi:hypothetical protein
MIAAVCVGGMAAAQTPTFTITSIAGRWASDDNKLVLDVARCGTENDWCGVEVAGASTCGRTALRIRFQKRRNSELEFGGRFERVMEVRPYAVRVILHHAEGRDHIALVGNPGTRFEGIRRTFPLDMLLSRAGDAQCRPDAQTS